MPFGKLFKDKPVIRNTISLLLIIVACVSLFFAQSSKWINNVVFDQQTFTDITTETLMKEQNRRAIARSVIDEAFRNRPLADKLIGDRSVSYISELLGSELSSRAVSRVASAGYAYLTSSDKQDIAIDLTAIKTPVSIFVSVMENNNRESRVDPSILPDSVVLISSSELPEVYKFISGVVVFGVFYWLLTIMSLAMFVYINRKNLVRSLYIIGMSVIGVSVLAIFTGPFVPSIIASFINNINLRIVVVDLASVYLQPFIRQMYTTILLSLIALFIVRFRQQFINLWHAGYKLIK